jgi:hypothetical protein
MPSLRELATVPERFTPVVRELLVDYKGLTRLRTPAANWLQTRSA